FIGSRSGQSNTSGSYNLFIGKEAGLTNYNGMNNIFAGYKSGKYNTTGYENTFIGDHTGMQNTTGYLNTYVGANAGYYNIGTTSNTLIGASAGAEAKQSGFNTFVGARAGEYNTGSENVFIGDWAGRYNTGYANVFIGNEADMDGSNKLVISNGWYTPLISGDFALGHVGINNGSPGWMFVVGTSNAYCDGGAWVDGSSREVKENIVALTSAEALQAFAKLEPVKFNYKQDKEEPRLGFIAEDVPELVAEKGRKGLSPMDMVAVLTKVVQEQQKTLLELQEKIAKLGEK
ncbi:MAG TPA: tail fiber domain-containing protein, partial [Patescibacteria group bacterium]|nr:tail fiber domain-containing protein [Patescibacteria group bacterium]